MERGTIAPAARRAVRSPEQRRFGSAREAAVARASRGSAPEASGPVVRLTSSSGPHRVSLGLGRVETNEPFTFLDECRSICATERLERLQLRHRFLGPPPRPPPAG